MIYSTPKKIARPSAINTFFLILFAALAEANHGEFNTAAEILIFPYGSREISMAGAVLTNSTNESAVFWNPALLGRRETRYQSGALQYHFDKPFPISSWPAERHHSISACFQPAQKNAGGFGINVSHYNRGERNWTDEWGRTLGSANLWEGLYSFSWGFGFQEIGIENHQFGVSAKYIHSALAPGLGAENESIGRSFALDFGYYWEISDLFSFGLTLINMGPALWYISQDEALPLPFNGNIAIGANKNLKIGRIPLDITAEYKLKRFFIKDEIDKQPDPFYKALVTSWKNKTGEENWNSILHSIGYEITFFDMIHLRQGFYIDNRYNENEMRYGIGGSIIKHFDFDLYGIYSPNTKYRHGAWGFTLSAYRLWIWK